jgi:hypothetical protein
MNKSFIKREVEELLRKRDFQSLLELCEKKRAYWQEVRYRLYDMDEVLRWSAIEIAGRLMKKWWDSGNEEKARIYIRTLFWSLNDESGGIGWSSAQTIAEIIAQNRELIHPYGSMMIAHCIDEPPLLIGCFWGIGRIGRLMGETVKIFKDKILEALNTVDVDVLGTAAWAFGESGFAMAVPFLQKLIVREEQVTIYIEGTFYEKPIRKWAEEALMKIKMSG